MTETEHTHSLSIQGTEPTHIVCHKCYMTWPVLTEDMAHSIEAEQEAHRQADDKVALLANQLEAAEREVTRLRAMVEGFNDQPEQLDAVPVDPNTLYVLAGDILLLPSSSGEGQHVQEIEEKTGALALLTGHTGDPWVLRPVPQMTAVGAEPELDEPKLMCAVPSSRTRDSQVKRCTFDLNHNGPHSWEHSEP